MVRAITDVALMAQLDPAVIENIDKDKWTRRIIALRGVSPDLLAPAGAAQEFREAQQQAQQQAQEMMMAGEAAKAAGALQ
jgi:hypothetical protein